MADDGGWRRQTSRVVDEDGGDCTISLFFKSSPATRINMLCVSFHTKLSSKRPVQSRIVIDVLKTDNYLRSLTVTPLGRC